MEVIRPAPSPYPHCEPLVISMFGDEDNVLASIEARASPISPMIARRVLLKYWSDQTVKEKGSMAQMDASQVAINTIAFERSEGGPQRSLLAPREQDVLALISRGFSNLEIARLQGVTVHRVQPHIKNLYGKLAVHSKNEAVFVATRMGLLSSHD